VLCFADLGCAYAGARHAAVRLPFDLLTRSVEVKKAQQKRARHFQGSVRGCACGPCRVLLCPYICFVIKSCILTSSNGNLPPVLTCIVWHCRFHMDQLMNMGNYHVRDIDGIVKRSELYNETLMQMEVSLPDGTTNFV